MPSEKGNWIITTTGQERERERERKRDANVYSLRTCGVKLRPAMELRQRLVFRLRE